MHPEELDNGDSWLEGRDFDDVLYRIRQRPEQVELQRRQTSLFTQSWLFILLSGAILGLAVFAWLRGSAWWIVAALVIAFVPAVVGANKRMIRSLKIAKEQDRRYFLACIREARSIDELSQTGLFAFLEHRVGEEVEAERGNEASRLRSALEHRSEQKTDWKTKPRKYDSAESDRSRDELDYLSGKNISDR